VGGTPPTFSSGPYLENVGFFGGGAGQYNLELFIGYFNLWGNVTWSFLNKLGTKWEGRGKVNWNFKKGGRGDHARHHARDHARDHTCHHARDHARDVFFVT
jgi:hypothetical protein